MEKSSVDKRFVTIMDILQPENGYRFTTDSLILAAHVRTENNERLLDIGTGCGIIPLLLASKYPDLDITGIELQTPLYRMACRNISVNHPDKNIRISNKDINQVSLNDINGPAEIIVSNPPYKKKGSGRLNPDSEKAIARHEIHLDIDQLFNCSKKLLKEQGALYLIFPADRLEDLQSVMVKHEFGAKFMRFIHTKKSLPPKRVVVCAVKNGRQSGTINPPLHIYSDENQYTKEYLDLIQPYDKAKKMV